MEKIVAGLSTLDYVIFAVYAIVVIAIGLFASKKNTKSAEGYISPPIIRCTRTTNRSSTL